MRKRGIGIDRLTVRLRGIPAEAARGVVRELGHDLIGELAQRRTDTPRNGRIDRLDAGTTEIAPGATTSDLRRAIVARIVAAIHPTRT